MLNPDYCILLDCGTIPAPTSLSKFITAFDNDDQIGGLCGTLGLYITNYYAKNEKTGFIERIDKDQYDSYGFLYKFFLLFFNIQRAQIFDYMLSHIYSKSFESITGFINVLPGAFSAYRWFFCFIFLIKIKGGFEGKTWQTLSVG